MLNPSTIEPTLPPDRTWTTETQEDSHFPQKATTNLAKQGVSMSIPSPSTTLMLQIITLFPMCGGINPYTLTASFGLGDLAHYETARGLIQLPRVSRKETR